MPGRGSVETRVFVKPRRVLRVLEERGRPLFEFMLEDRACAERMLAAASAVPKREVDRDLHLARLFFAFAREARGVDRVVEKTPAHAHHLAEIRAAFPEARVIACVRHPVEVYSSVRKRLARVAERGRDRPGLAWLRATPAEFCQRYAERSALLVEASGRAADPALLVRYEDLTADPASALTRVCDFVGEPFEEGPLLGDVAERRDPHGSPRLRARIAANRKSWREFLDAETAREIEERLALAMEKLGYAPIA